MSSGDKEGLSTTAGTIRVGSAAREKVADDRQTPRKWQPHQSESTQSPCTWTGDMWLSDNLAKLTRCGDNWIWWEKSFLHMHSGAIVERIESQWRICQDHEESGKRLWTLQHRVGLTGKCERSGNSKHLQRRWVVRTSLYFSFSLISDPRKNHFLQYRKYSSDPPIKSLGRGRREIYE